MVKIELVIKGPKGELKILGDSFTEVQNEYTTNRQRIEDLLGKSVSKEVEPIPEGTETQVPAPTTLQGRILSLVQNDFFQSPRNANEVKERLRGNGYAYDAQRTSVALMRLVRKKHLRRLLENDVYVYVNP